VTVPGAGAWPPATVRFVRLAILALILTIPFAVEVVYQRVSASQLYYLKVAGLTVAILTIGMIVALRLPVGRPTPLLTAWLIYLGVVVISILANPVRGFGMAKAILPATAAGLLFAFEAMPAGRRARESVLLLLVGVGFLCALYGILQNFGVNLIPGAAPVSERQVIGSFFGHSNFLASFLGPIVFLAVYFVQPGRRPALIRFAIAAIFLSIVCFFWAGTRAATLAALAGALTLVRNWRWPRLTFSRRALGIAAAVVIVAGLLAALYGQKFGRHPETLWRRAASAPELRNRVFFWIIGAEMIRDHPVIGIGYGRYNSMFWDYAYRYVSRPENQIHSYILREMRGANPGQAHNELIGAAAETGILGLAAFLAVWIAALGLCNHVIRAGAPDDQRLARCLRAALVFVFVDGLFGFPSQVPASALVFWTVLGMVAQTWLPYAARDVAAENRASAAAPEVVPAGNL
jgi:O-antigen ligase